MRENLKYVNHLNEVYEFSQEDSYVFEHTLRNYSWNVITKNNRVAGFHKSISAKNIPLLIHTRDDLHSFEIRNRLYEITEKDVLAEKPGRLILDGYYLSCYVTESQKSEFLYRKRHMKLALTVTTAYPYWCRETKNSYMKGQQAELKGLDYPTDFPFDYILSVTYNTLFNPNFVASNFIIRIFGACSTPAITIGENTYKVNCEVGENEQLIINSKDKTIQLKQSNGAVVNKFKNRDKEHYIFERIPPGTTNIGWDGSFGFDVVLIEERSEPKWT